MQNKASGKERPDIRMIALRILSLVLVLGWMYVIGGFSSQNAEESSNLSREVSFYAVDCYNAALDADLTETERTDWADRLETPVRKLAHMTEYGILAALAMFSLWTFGIQGKKQLFSIAFCSLYAVTDEYHQTWVEGRAGRFTDVLIDTSGAALAFALISIVISGIVKFKFKQNKEKQ